MHGMSNQICIPEIPLICLTYVCENKAVYNILAVLCVTCYGIFVRNAQKKKNANDLLPEKETKPFQDSANTPHS